MKINPLNNSAINPYKRQQAKVEQAEAQKQKTTDKLEISNQAKELLGNGRIQAERREKVDQLKSEVENGTYKADPKKTAEDLLKFFRS
ncbi:flagellar biosynthesis anti-sigma factor FlgM [Jeotgalibacillus sp. R-1-5s-1]|uniref:flagellar biosynthesis anti-sigma factor FlgM n=1 Tax=Jeotgalibacillus sp. R-1-5s-1 TaxID=2555897 RepID=UPI00106B5FF7|nr:flagellar biosynthesis anti-sigma factor FlgM [Jeotgalibacillus sp. R-1-5s-1]TFD95785.1 flagellar biosynthesis anti-sigma factor FlgM [Jeotgalibacillus sp. R-1-5s-1]